MCALLEGTKYTESRIGIVETVTNDEFRNQSVLNGEYVATCAKQRCGYFCQYSSHSYLSCVLTYVSSP